MGVAWGPLGGPGPARSPQEDRTGQPGSLPRDRGPRERSDPPSRHQAKPSSSEHLGVAPAVWGLARGTAGVALTPGLVTSVGCQRDPREDRQSLTGRQTLPGFGLTNPAPRDRRTPTPLWSRHGAPLRPAKVTCETERDRASWHIGGNAPQSGPAERNDKFGGTSRVTRLVGWFF